MTDGGALLDVRGLGVSYGGFRALRDVEFQVHSGDVVAVVGLNGAGKSSLLRGISGLVATQGHLTLGGADLGRLNVAQRAALGLGHVPEGRRLFPRMSVLDNLRVGALGRARPLHRTRVIEEVKDMFPAIVGLLHQRADSLSGGEQQLVAIGRAVMAQPRLLMLDEPSLGLSPIATQTVARAIGDLASNGTGVLLAEQNINLALQLASQIHLIAFGELVETFDNVQDAAREPEALAHRIYSGITQHIG